MQVPDKEERIIEREHATGEKSQIKGENLLVEESNAFHNKVFYPRECISS